MTFKHIINLKVYQGLPFVKAIQLDEQDPVSPLHTRPLDITGRTLVAVINARPKVKAYELKILNPNPLPGIYSFLLIYGGKEYPFEVELLDGEGAKELQAKIIAAIKGLGLGFYIGVCAPSCADAYEIVIAGLWPGVDWTLEIVDQPVGDPPEDQIELDILQENIPLAEFAVTSQVVDDQLVVTIKLNSDETGGIPAAGDGPYLWRLVAPLDAEPKADMLLLARGHIVMERA